MLVKPTYAAVTVASISARLPHEGRQKREAAFRQRQAETRDPTSRCHPVKGSEAPNVCVCVLADRRNDRGFKCAACDVPLQSRSLCLKSGTLKLVSGNRQKRPAGLHPAVTQSTSGPFEAEFIRHTLSWRDAVAKQPQSDGSDSS